MAAHAAVRGSSFEDAKRKMECLLIVSHPCSIPVGFASLQAGRISERSETHYVPRNALSIQLPDRMLQSNHVVRRKFRGTAGGVIGNFCVVDIQKKSTLLP
jgi:hypothetical protein